MEAQAQGAQAQPTSTADMMQSATLGRLGAALSKAQGAMGTAKKDGEAEIVSQKGTYRYNYADLASVWDAVRKHLADNELSIVQQVHNDTKSVTVTTTLLHSSGEFIRDRCWLPVSDMRPQSVGSAITYARRYSMSALVGVATEDDDGAAGVAAAAKQTARQTPPKRPEQPAQEAQPAQTQPQSGPPDQRAAIKAMVSRMWKEAKTAGVSVEAWEAWSEQVLGRKVGSDRLTADEVHQLEAKLPNLLTRQPGADG